MRWQAEEQPVRSRRRVLASLAAFGTAGLAGCGSTTADREPTPSPTPGRSSEATETPEEATETQTPTDSGADDARSLPDPLSVDASNPFVYVNDQNDNYNAEVALAMASRGYVELRGFLLSYAGEPWLSSAQFERRREAYVIHHETVHERARQSGFDNLPPAELGVVGERHRRPASGDVGETRVIGSTGTDRLVEEARRASRERPLVVAVGSDVCTVADAYLADPGLAERVVVFLRWTGDPRDPGYNVFQSGWSARVVLENLACVLVGTGAPLLRARQVRALPDEPLRQFMLEKEHADYGSPLRDGRKWDGDSGAILTAAHPDTRVESRRGRLDGTLDPPFDAPFQVPSVTYGAGAQELHDIVETRGLTEAFWSHLTHPETWG